MTVQRRARSIPSCSAPYSSRRSAAPSSATATRSLVQSSPRCRCVLSRRRLKLTRQRGGPALAAGVPPQNGRANGKLVPSEDESSDSDESITEGGADEDLTKVVAGPSDACKLVRPKSSWRRLSCQVLVVRTDLGMSNGKIAAQCSCASTFASATDRCSHATLSCYKAVSKANPALLRAWEREGCVARDVVLD